MFDSSLPDPAALRRVDDAALVEAISGWTRTSAAAEARAMVGIAELVRRRCVEEHPDWACDDWDAAAAEISAALTASHSRASGLMDLAVTVRDRLPKVGALFLAGDITGRMVATIAERTFYVQDQQAWTRLDDVIAQRAVAWGPLSQYKLKQAVDVWVDQIDPAAVRRTRTDARNRDFVVGEADEKSGTTRVEGRLLSTDAALFDRRVAAMAHGVCEDDPRTLKQRRSDALGALGAGSFHLTCLCGNPQCPAAADDGRASNVFVHVIAEKESVASEPDPQMHGEEVTEPRPTPSGLKREQRPPEPPEPTSEQPQAEPETEQERSDAGPNTVPDAEREPEPVPEAEQPEPDAESEPDVLSESESEPQLQPQHGAELQPRPEPPPKPKPTAQPKAGVIPGGGIVPAWLLADLINRGATVKPVRTPGPDPEPRYRPSTALALFVRTRDVTCRFPGCDRPAERSDLDHTIPYPQGLTHASGLGCRCRRHHLLKTFWDGWSEQQLPDGTIIFTTPTGLSYPTKPGAALLFPGWNTTTPAPVGRGDPATPMPPSDRELSDARTLMMPKRKRTRAQARASRIKQERALNDAYIAERNIPPPF